MREIIKKAWWCLIILGLQIGPTYALSSFIANEFNANKHTQDTSPTNQAQPSVLQKRLAILKKNFSPNSLDQGFSLQMYEPNYVLPYFYNEKPSPYYAQHPNSTPNEKIKRQEFKAQLSFLIPIWENMFNSPISLNAAYTQDMFWQVYSKSPFFRETNYEPRLFISQLVNPNILVSLGFDHQSNGRGGEGKGGMERSWNRIFADILFSRGQWMVGVEPWIPILKKWSQDHHNPDIADYLGYGKILMVYKFHNNQEVSLMLRNIVASGFKRGAIEFDYSFPLHGMISGYVQVFSGYGQSLIEYNHYTNAVGVGFSFSNWI